MALFSVSYWVGLTDGRHFPLPGDQTMSYSAGDTVVIDGKAFSLIGNPVKEWYGAKDAACRVTFPAKELDIASVPTGLRQPTRK